MFAYTGQMKEGEHLRVIHKEKEIKMIPLRQRIVILYFRVRGCYLEVVIGLIHILNLFNNLSIIS